MGGETGEAVGTSDAGGDTGRPTPPDRLLDAPGAFLLCVAGYTVTVLALVVWLLLTTVLTNWLFGLAGPAAWPGSALARALLVGPSLLGLALVAAVPVLTDLVVTRRLARVSRTDTRATADG
jgi:hypothetical protein